MRILFDSKQQKYKDPFGTLTPDQPCRIQIRIPNSVPVTKVQCIVQRENGEAYQEFPLERRAKEGVYSVFGGTMVLSEPGLYFYYFHVSKPEGGFRLFKQGDGTNMEAGDLWQVSCIPEDFTTPDWAKGATIYQIFPDRFCKSGSPDLTGKLEPYILHKDWNEDVYWEPDEDGEVLNNDFFGGNFRGIMEKLDYLDEMGVGILYLNPISKSFSSHRYDTGDYKTPDPMLGTQEDFAELCRQAHLRGMYVVLDGVYSHTGSNSLYFNRDGAFPEVGAFQSQDSPYYEWYQFDSYPETYQSWWNFDTLPTVKKMTPSYMDYIINDEDSVVAHWLKLGADGFRLDVVDELPDAFVAQLKRRIRQIKPDALLIGEVWEDASKKIAYDQRRRYFVDAELDSVMNYPFRNAIVRFMRKLDDGRELKDTVMSIVENYPPQVMACTMNLLGSHDTARILTALMDSFEGSREEQAHRHLSRKQWTTAQERLQAASFLQFMLPGAPSIYYGDEAGMEGYNDPFCRRTYPWGREDRELLAHYRLLGKLRKALPALRLGDIQFFCGGNLQLGFSRSYRGQTVKVYLNRSSDNWEIPAARKLHLGHNLINASDDGICLGHMGYCLLEE